MWIVMHGAITVIEEGGSNGAQEVAEIGEGRSFGELAVMGDEGERQRQLERGAQCKRLVRIRNIKHRIRRLGRLRR